MFKEVDVQNQLARLRQKTRSGAESLVSEANRILRQDLFSEKKILDNLLSYNRAFECIDEEDVDHELIFTQADVKQICIRYRLKFLESKLFRPEMPYEAVLRIKHLDQRFNKALKDFKILAPLESFAKKDQPGEALLFVKTNYDNYFLVHRWGHQMPWHRQFRYWPMRHFENLFITIIVVTLAITLSLPTWLITLDATAEYWSGYRAAAFFHLLIFNMGVTAYTTFTFAKNFSSTVWNRQHDFD